MYLGTEDEDLFIPASNSNLASLFGTNLNVTPDHSKNLIYTAPKQPKPGNETPKSYSRPTTQIRTIYSTFVDIYKLIDKKPILRGKCGVAIIGNETLKNYEVMIYKSKQHILMRTKLNPDFNMLIENKIVYISDEQKQEWYMQFQNTQDVESFIHEIKEQGGKIMYSNKDIPLLNILDNDINKTNENFVDAAIALDKSKESDSHSDTSGSKTRANILSRMAKMGKPILPVTKKVADESDSETEGKVSHQRSIKKRQKHATNKGETEFLDAINNANNEQLTKTPEFVLVNGQLLPVSTINQNTPYSNNQFVSSIPTQLMFNYPQMPSTSDSLHMFISENRTHNCEIRMNMVQMSSKLDVVLEKLTKDRYTTDKKQFQMNDEKILEEKNQIIKTFEEENHQLQKIISENKQVINNLMQKNTNQQNIISQHEQEIKQFNEQQFVIQDKTAKMAILQKTIEEQKQTITNLERTINDQKINLESLTELYEEHKSKQNNLQTINNSNDGIANLEYQLEDDGVSKANLFAQKLKQSMNLLYQQIMENFQDKNTTFQSQQIKEILSKQLKSATFSIIQEFENDFKNKKTITQVEENITLAV